MKRYLNRRCAWQVTTWLLLAVLVVAQAAGAAPSPRVSVPQSPVPAGETSANPPADAAPASLASVPDFAPALTVETFFNPPTSVRPKYRWWHPLASTDDAEIIKELQEMKDLGAGGAEIDAFRASTGDSYQSSLDTNNNPYLATYGWGTPLWMHKIQVALQAAKDLGLYIDQGQGPRWPPSFPTLDSLNQPGVAKQMIYGKAQLAIGTSEPISIPTTFDKTPPSRTTATCAAANIGDSSIKVANGYGLSIGDVVTIGSGAGLETVTLTGATKGAPSACTTLVAPAAAGATNIKVADLTGFYVGLTFNLDTGAVSETLTVSSVGTGASRTTLSQASLVGDTSIKVASITGFVVGHVLVIDTGANVETATITGLVSGGFGSPATVNFSPALAIAHASGAPVIDPGTGGINLTSPLANAHTIGAAVASSTLDSSVTFVPALGKAHAAIETVEDQAKKTLIAVLIAQCATSACSTAPVALDLNSVQNVTWLVNASGQLFISGLGNRGPGYDFSGGTLPSGNGNPWWVINFYQTADSQTAQGFTTTSPNYIVDYLSADGAAATANFYEGKPEPGADYTSPGLLGYSDPSIPNYDPGTPTIQSLINAIGSFNIFDDSFELSNSNVRWTGDLPSYWASKRGYDMTKYLPALTGVGAFGMTTPAFDFTSMSGVTLTIGQRVRIDYRQTLSDLYIIRYAQTVKIWANSHGITTRSQAYGASVDTAYGNAYVDVPEGESLTLGNDPEKNKLIAAGAHVQDRAVMSFECCAGFGGAGNTLFSGTSAVPSAIYKGMAGGVTQLVWHGYGYLKAPNGTGALWPGYSFGGYGSVSEAWGPRNPNNADYRKVNDHLARLQLVLRQGKPRFDVAVYWQDYGINAGSSFGGGGTAGTVFTTLSAMAQNGYTYEYVSPDLLTKPEFSSKAIYTAPASAGDLNNGAFFPNQSAYKALVLNTLQRLWIRRDAAEKILSLAQGDGTHDGLPVVIIGADCSAGCTAPTITTQGLQTGDDAATQAAMNALYGLIGDGNSKHHVIAVATEAGVPAALATFGIQPASKRASVSSAAAALNIVHRKTSDADYYFFYNYSAAAITQTLTLDGSGVPYSLDVWSGKIERIANFTSVPGGVTVSVRLAANDVAVVAVSGSNLDGNTAPTLHATGTTADKVLYKNGQLAIRVGVSGEYTTSLSSGRTVSTTVTDLPDVMPLDSWTLSVDGWSAGPSGLPGDTAHTPIPASGAITVTANITHQLPAWTAITPANGFSVNLSTISGIGIYTASIDLPSGTLVLPSGWTGGLGAYLDLGSAVDTSEVTVNGTVVPPYSYLDLGRIDVGPYLHDGANTIVVKIATTLSNAVKAYPPQGVTTRASQNYGLMGPVRLVPYRDATIWSVIYLPIVMR